MSLVTTRHISQDELASWRAQNPRAVGRQRAVSSGRTSQARLAQSHDVEMGDNGTVYMSAPARPGVKRDAREVVGALMDRRFNSIQRMKQSSPAQYQAYADELRRLRPGLTASMTDDEIIRTVFQRVHEDATAMAYRNAGRDKAVL